MKQTHSTLRKTIWALLIAFIICGTIPKSSLAQEPNVYVIVELMKVEQGNEEMYLDIEQNIWKKIHQERVNNGTIMGWILYRVKFTGENDEYNYATATVFDNRSNIEDPFKGIDPQKILPDIDADEAMSKTVESRKLVKSQLIRRLDFAYPANSAGPPPFKFIHVNYMKVKPASGYPYIARTVWKPVLQEYVNQGTRAAWTLWQTVYPRGFAEDYQYIAVDYFSEWSQIGTSNFNEAFKKVHPGKNSNELMKESRESRTLVKTELWELVDMVMRGQ